MAESHPQDDAPKEKVLVSLKPAGNAPLLNKKKFLVEGNRTIGWMHQWLRKNLKCEAEETMFVYVAQAFAPSLDITLQSLYKCYGTGDRLILHYCKTPAWG